MSKTITEEDIVKFLLMWANNEEIGMRNKNNKLLILTQNHLSSYKDTYIYNLSREFLCEDYTDEDVLELIKKAVYGTINVSDDKVKEILDSAKGYCIDCNVPLFDQFNVKPNAVECNYCLD